MTDIDIASLLKNFSDDLKRDFSQKLRENADISVRNHEETRREISGIKGELHEVKNTVSVLWRKVNGPNVPPPKTSGEYRQVTAGLAQEKPLVASVSQHDLDVEGLKGQVEGLNMKVDGVDTKVDGVDSKVEGVTSKVGVLDEKVGTLDKKLGEAKETVSEVKKIADKVLALNEKQNESLGVGISIRKLGDFLGWLKTKEGQRFGYTVIAAVGSITTALGTMYALLTNRLPMPTDPVPTVQTVYVPVPMALPSDAGAGPSTHP